MNYKIKQLGKLDVVEIYDYYDGPKFFTVRDKTGSFYAVYWCDFEDAAEGWLYLPLSAKRLDALRSKNISVHDAYIDPEIGYWLVYTRVEPRKEETIQFHSKDSINNEFIPPEGMYVEYVDVIETGDSNWDHELRIVKDSATTTPSAEVATEVFGLWTTIIESTMNLISKSQTIHIASALPGSLEVKVGSSNSVTTYKAIEHINSVFCSDLDDGDLEENLYAAGLEPHILRELFETARSNELNITIRPRSLGILDEPITINHVDADNWIQRLEPLTSTVLGTDKIPQADEISKIIEIINYKCNGVEITSQLLGITDRQVRYYEDAAQNLGVLDKHRNLTSIGYFINSQASEEEKLSALSIRFETSDCGWSWIKWSELNSLVELDESTAVDFLIAVAPGLRESTARRRASTLRLWLRKLKPHHYKYQNE